MQPRHSPPARSGDSLTDPQIENERRALCIDISELRTRYSRLGLPRSHIARALRDQLAEEIELIDAALRFERSI